MKILYKKWLVILAGICLFTLKAQAQNYAWGLVTGDESFDYARDLAVDESGNSYVVGSFRGVADFDPSAGVTELVCPVIDDAFVAKYDPNGALVWAFSFGSETCGEEAQVIAADGAGRIYVGGYLDSIAFDIDPGPGIEMISSGSNNFIACFTTDGEYVWSFTYGNPVSETIFDLLVSSDNHLLMCGRISDNTDMDPTDGQTVLEVPFGNAAFVAKYTLEGQLAWAAAFLTQENSAAHVEDLATDGAGNVYAGGTFRLTYDFDPGPGTATLTAQGIQQDAFLVKLDIDGNFTWVKQLSGTAHDLFVSVDVTEDGRIYAGGNFGFTSDLDPGPAVAEFTAAAAQDTYLMELDTDGNLVWVNVFPGTGQDAMLNVSIRSDGGIICSGDFTQQIDMDPTAGEFILSSANATTKDVFFAAYSAAGELEWARSFGGGGEDRGYAMQIDAQDNVLVAGTVKDMADLDPNEGEAMFFAEGEEDVFLAKYISGAPNHIPDPGSQVFRAYPNPVAELLMIESYLSYPIASIELLDAVGQMVSRHTSGCTPLIAFQMPATSGIYTLRIRYDNGLSHAMKVIRK